MTNTDTKPLGAACPMASKGELVVVPPPTPTLEELTSTIRRGHRAVLSAVVDALQNAIETGKALKPAKEEVGHGNFEEYVAVSCGFTIRTAQNYMRLAKHEAEIRQLVARKNEGRFVSINEALKYIDGLRKKNPRKEKSKTTT